MNLIQDLKSHFNIFNEHYKNNTALWLDVKMYIWQIKVFLDGQYFMGQQSIKSSYWKVICEYINDADIYKYIPENEINNLKHQITQIDRIINELTLIDRIEYNKLYETLVNNKKPYIFIGHGHNLVWARLALYLSDELNLKTVYYESNCHSGESIDKVLQEFIDKVGLAFLVFTGEDETKECIKRARQNVIHEAGLFRSKLNSDKTIILRQKGVEIPSNLAGIEYIEFDEDKIDHTFYPLQRVLKRESFINII